MGGGMAFGGADRPLPLSAGTDMVGATERVAHILHLGMVILIFHRCENSTYLVVKSFRPSIDWFKRRPLAFRTFVKGATA